MVRQTDLGRMVFQQPRPDRVYIAIPARQQGERWGALVMEMRASGRRAWRVTELTRAQDRNLARPHPLPEWQGPGDPDVALVELTRTTVAARTARTAAAERYAKARQGLAQVAPEKAAGELQPGDLVNTGTLQRQHWTEVRSIGTDNATGDIDLRVADGTTLRVLAERPVSVLVVHNGQIDTARQEAAAAADGFVTAAEELARWDRQLDLLEHEREGLVERRRVRHLDQAVEPQKPPSYVTRTLGLPPRDTAARRLWDAAAGAIETYREPWGITRIDCRER